MQNWSMTGADAIVVNEAIVWRDDQEMMPGCLLVLTDVRVWCQPPEAR